MGEYPGIDVFAWGKGGTTNNQDRNRLGGGGVQIGCAGMGDGSGEGQSTSGGQSSDDVREEGYDQATGGEQSVGNAPDVG